jgi:mono/diheme cytochrome c family protein
MNWPKVHIVMNGHALGLIIATILTGCWLGAEAGARPTRIVVAAPRARLDDRDDEELQERLALGRQSFQDNCLMCHGEELVAGQRLTAKQWAAELDKMIGWGAPVPADQKTVLLDYLNSRYSDKTPVQPPDRISLAEAFALLRPEPAAPGAEVGDAARGGRLYAAHCATCHGADARGGDLGTNLVARPVLFRAAEFAEVVRKGRRRMPGFALTLTPSQEADIRAWLIQQPVLAEKKP